jgi:hypothetical protein
MTYLCLQDEPNTSNARVGVSFGEFNFNQNQLMGHRSRLADIAVAQATIKK